MKAFLSLILAPVIFIARLLGQFGPPLGGSNKLAPTNAATLQFENLGRFAWPAFKISATVAGFTALFLVCGGETAAGVGICLALLCAPKATYALGIATAIPIFTDERLGEIDYYPVAAATKIPAGVLVGLNAGGAAVSASDAVSIRVIGRAEETVDNTSGAAGDLSVNVKRGVFKFANSAAHAITAAMVRKMSYVEDNQTVASTSTYLSPAGTIRGVDADGGVWIDTRSVSAAGRSGLTDSTTGTVGTTLAAGVGINTVTFPIENASIANGDIVVAYVPGYRFKLLKATYVTNKVVTTAAKLSTITPKISGVAVTGGVISLTSATMTPVGTLVAGTAVSATNVGSALDSITLTASATTAFVEGNGSIVLEIQNMDTADAVASLAAA